jgi:HAMP domain-containing protein
MRLSYKLAVLAAFAALFPLLFISPLVLSKVSTHAREHALDQLRSDSRAAGSLYEKRVAQLRSVAQTLAVEIATRALVSIDSLDRNSAPAMARLQDMLPRTQSDASLDFIVVSDPLGRVIARHNDRPSPGEMLLSPGDANPVAERVLTGTSLPVASCSIERGERYARLGLDRTAPVRLANGSLTDDALVIEACAPIFSGGRIAGAVLIGQMLNTYYKPRAVASSLQTPLVAEVRQTLARAGEEDAGALIALGRVIVASSIPPIAEGGPALLGSVHDPEKVEEVLQQGERSYNVAWQPLKSLDGAAIGAIGVARPSRELEGSAGAVRATIFLIAAIAVVLAGAAGFVFGLSLGDRLNNLTDVASRWSLGELSAPARDGTPLLSRWIPAEYLRDEVNRLAQQLDQMRDSFRQAIERMKKR